MKEFIKKNNKHIVIILLIALSGTLTCLLYRASVIRTAQAVRDLGLSIAFYFCSFVKIETPVTVTEFPDMDILKYLPYDFDEILRRLREMWSVFFDGNCFKTYLANVIDSLYNFSLIAMLLIPLILILRIVIVKALLTSNKKAHWEKSKPLIRFESKTLPRLVKIKNWFKRLFRLIRERKYYRWPLLLLWLTNLNILTIAIEALAFYFYFAMAFDFGGLFIQLGKLLVDLLIMFSGAPLIFWLAVAYTIIVIIRKAIGYKRLHVCEIANRQFIEEQPICFMITGTMGTGKTTMLTDIALTAEMMLREKAYEKILAIDAKYPNFPWILLEDALKEAIKAREIYNLTTCRDWIDGKCEKFMEDPCDQNIFGYDIEQYRIGFEDGITDRFIWYDLKNYACLYFIYMIESSLIVSNYSIRVDNVLHTESIFPRWSSDFFHSTPNDSLNRSRHAHILDYDALRLGKKVLKDNPRGASFEFGVVVMSEYGKERGNSLTHQELKKNDENANQKNDLFGYEIKMCRHKATVDNFPFVMFIADEQRPESLGADMRDLLNIVHIREKSPIKLLMPFFFITELLYSLFYKPWQNLYGDLRDVRGDRSLFIYLMHNGMSTFHNFYSRMYNIYGVFPLKLEVERGTQDGALEEKNYFICKKKIYSDRFSTDCYSGWFEPHLRKIGVGLPDYPEYDFTVASEEEMLFQNSYFIGDMEKLRK